MFNIIKCNYNYLWLNSLRSCLSWGLSLFVLIFSLSFPTQIYAAETIVFKYSFLRQSVSVKELSTFVETGEMSSSLRNFFESAKQDPETIRQVLGEKITVDAIILSKFLNTFVGEILLNIVSGYIQTPSGRASTESLRGALVISALPDNNISLMEILENYPTSEIHVEGDRLVELYQRLKDLIDQIPTLETIMK
jgi:hypothetical protein